MTYAKVSPERIGNVRAPKRVRCVGCKVGGRGVVGGRGKEAGAVAYSLC